MNNRQRKNQPLQKPSSKQGMVIAFVILLVQGLWMGRQIRWTLSQRSSSCSGHATPQKLAAWRTGTIKATSSSNRTTASLQNRTGNNIQRKYLIQLPNYQDRRPLTLFYPNNETYQGPQRVFRAWRYPEFPCGPAEEGYHRGPTPSGFLYMKEFKTGSSTLAGISLRIGRNVAMRKNMSLPCTVRCAHLRARKYKERLKNESFLWSVLREPTTRLVSKFYHFAVSREKVAPTVANMQEYFRRQRNRAYDRQYYLKTLSLRDINPRADDITIRKYVEEILQGFDFIGITERMDETLVVLQLLLRLETGDLLYISAKESGSWEYFPMQRCCKHIMKYAVTPAMKDWFRSEEWYEYVRGDVIMYKAANRSLDLTIKRLGPDRVQRGLVRFRWAQQLAEKRCSKTTRFVCSGGGDHNAENDCLWQDMGCGYACLDKVAAELKTSPNFNALPEIG